MNNSTDFDNIIESICSFKEYMEIEKWENFQLDFGESNKDKIIKSIKSKVELENGIYAIFVNKHCLYIGIGRPIWARIKSHYYAAQGNESIKKWAIRWSEFFQSYQSTVTIYWKEFNYIHSQKIEGKIKLLIEALLEQKYRPKFEFSLHKDLYILAVEAQAQSRYLICKKGDTSYRLTVVVGEEEDYPQDELHKIENVITFNAFTELESEQAKTSKMEYYLKRLNATSIQKINEIFKLRS